MARLNAYNFDGNQLIDYCWDIALGEALYPMLRTVEIVLRNKLKTEIALFLSDEYWLIHEPSKILLPHENKILSETKDEIKKKCPNRLKDIDYLISELNFGFWTNLFNKRYERILWPDLLMKIFPYLPKKCRTSQFLNKRFQDIRKLRNRIFHHQRIFHLQDLQLQHTHLIEAIKWIEPTLFEHLKLIDRFDEVFKYGRENIKQGLKNEV